MDGILYSAIQVVVAQYGSRMEHKVEESRSTSPPNVHDAHRHPVRLQPISLRSIDASAAETGDRHEDESDKKGSSLFWEIAETLLLALLIFMVVRTVVLNFRVDGLSMEPSLDTGQMLLVNRQVYSHFDLNGALNVLPFIEREGENIVYPFHPPQRGDIIVFNPPVGQPDRPYIKRVVALPGETVSIHDGEVHVNGTPLDEDYLGATSTSWPSREDDYSLLVPEEHIFVMGDNRNNSTDSRQFGPVSYDAVIGKAWISYWPSNHFGILGTPTYAR